jgi:hypothetical protein
MGRPLKISKTNPMAGIFYDNTSQGSTAKSVNVDQAYPPFAAPTSIDLPTVVKPTGANPPWLGVVGGAPVLSSPSALYPVVECQVNIALPSGSGQGVSNGRIIRQKGNRKFLVVSSGTQVEDESMVVGASYMIGSLDTTNWQQMGAPAGAIPGTIFTCTALCADPQNGYGWLVGTCVLDNTTSPTVGNMAITFSYGDSSAMYVSKLTNRFLQDFAGGETGGNANTGNVWNPAQVKNNVLFDANFFTDEGTFAKSGAEVDTWESGSQNSNGTLNLGIVENYTS